MDGCNFYLPARQPADWGYSAPRSLSEGGLKQSECESETSSKATKFRKAEASEKSHNV